jgi:HEAT repeat protein
MIPLKLRRFWRARRQFTVCFLLYLCVLGLPFAAHGQSDNVSALIADLSSPDAGVRMKAVNALGQAKDPRAVEPLIGALNDTDFGVRSRAPLALGEIGAPAVESLIAALKHPYSNVRQGAAMALGIIKDPRAVEPLIDAIKVKGQDFNARDDAAWALSAIKDPRAVDPLIALLKDPNTDSFVLLSAARVLGNIKDPRAIDPLIARLKEPGNNVPWYAAALGGIGTPAVEPLIAALKNSNSDVREREALALGEINDPEAINFLLAAWKARDFHVIVGADSFFIKRGEPGSEDLLIEALDKFANVGMVEDFLNSGNAKLGDAARAWATSRGFPIMTTPGVGSAHWGGGR